MPEAGAGTERHDVLGRTAHSTPTRGAARRGGSGKMAHWTRSAPPGATISVPGAERFVTISGGNSRSICTLFAHEKKKANRTLRLTPIFIGRNDRPWTNRHLSCHQFLAGAGFSLDRSLADSDRSPWSSRRISSGPAGGGRRDDETQLSGRAPRDRQAVDIPHRLDEADEAGDLAQEQIRLARRPG